VRAGCERMSWFVPMQIEIFHPKCPRRPAADSADTARFSSRRFSHASIARCVSISISISISISASIPVPVPVSHRLPLFLRCRRHPSRGRDLSSSPPPMLSATRRSSVLLCRQFALPHPHRLRAPALPIPKEPPVGRQVTCKRFYADEKPKEKVYVDPYLPPDPEELDARFSDIPDWKVPPVNPQNLTPYPEVPYDDPQNRRYYGEPVSSPPTSSA